MEIEKWRSLRTELWGTKNALHRYPQRRTTELGSKKIWDQVLALLFTDYIILRKSLAYYGHQFPMCQIYLNSNPLKI